ncbi:GQ67_01096T0 [Komagataella phaffii]|nr:GQ67_01096T0 [Komagataella phaffii]AOA68095.1 GQ68_00293T0 [Komagataella phaffii GS115]
MAFSMTIGADSFMSVCDTKISSFTSHSNKFLWILVDIFHSKGKDLPLRGYVWFCHIRDDEVVGLRLERFSLLIISGTLARVFPTYKEQTGEEILYVPSRNLPRVTAWPSLSQQI